MTRILTPRVLTRRRSLIGAGSLAAGLVLAPAIVSGRSALPDKSLRIVVGFVAGGGADTVARLMARALQRRLGRYVVVENRPGSAGANPGELIRTGPPDGSMVALLASNSLACKLSLKNFPYDPVTDIAPLGLAGTFPIAFAASPRLGVATFAEYLDWLNKGDATRRRLGNTSSDAFIEVLGHAINRALNAGLQIVPYRGAAPMVNDLADGRLPAAVTAVTSFLQHHRGGRLRLLMTSGSRPLKVAPEVPTARDLGVDGLDMQEWYGLFAPLSTPREIVDEWNRQLEAVLTDEDIVSEMAQLGLDAAPATPEATRARLIAHLADWKIRMQEAGMTPTS
jgi:tripartite-type tricarboxylate transporter receptor subunit TctC